MLKKLRYTCCFNGRYSKHGITQIAVYMSDSANICETPWALQAKFP